MTGLVKLSFNIVFTPQIATVGCMVNDGDGLEVGIEMTRFCLILS